MHWKRMTKASREARRSYRTSGLEFMVKSLRAGCSAKDIGIRSQLRILKLSLAQDRNCQPDRQRANDELAMLSLSGP